MPLSTYLMSYLKKGTFPLFSSDGLVAWAELIKELTADADAVWRAIIAGAAANHQDSTSHFPTTACVNDVDIVIVEDDLLAFLGATHAAMCSNFTVATSSQVQPLIQSLRAVMAPYMEESTVQLWLNPSHLMSGGMTASPLTCIPDQARNVTFGSAPNQKLIAQEAPLWAILKRRAYEPKGKLTKYGAKPHYVLAHLLNHNLNGSGADAKNVVPLWAAANTDMSNRVEKVVKELVQRGATSRYVITCGGPVGMTTGRKALKAQCQNEQQWALIEAEATLPEHLIIAFDVYDHQNKVWVSVLKEPITNFVPETVPYLRKA